VLREHVEERVEPALGRNRVVVEQYQDVAAGERRAAIARSDEAQVIGVALEAHARHRCERVRKRLG